MPALRDADPIRTARRGRAAHDVLVPDVPGWDRMSDIEARCQPAPDGWRCAVTVRDQHGSSNHDVTVSGDDATTLAAASAAEDVERLVYETFDFLLEREPKESIMRSFDLPVIERYFPEYPDEIVRRLR